MANQNATMQRFRLLTDEEKETYLFSKITLLEIKVNLLNREKELQEQKGNKQKKIIENLSESDRKCFELSQQGYRIAEIAEKLGWNYAKAHYHQRKIELFLKSPNTQTHLSKRRFSQEDMEKFMQLTEQGYSVAKISRVLGRTLGSVYQLRYKLKKQHG